jgi:hypothetical protein
MTVSDWGLKVRNEQENMLFGCGFAGGMQLLEYPVELASEIFFEWVGVQYKLGFDRRNQNGVASKFRPGFQGIDEKAQQPTTQDILSQTATLGLEGSQGTAEAGRTPPDADPWQQVQAAVIQAVGAHLLAIDGRGIKPASVTHPSANKRHQQSKSKQHQHVLLLLLPALKALVRWRTVPEPAWANHLADAIVAAAAPESSLPKSDAPSGLTSAVLEQQQQQQQQQATTPLFEVEPELLLSCTQLLGAAASASTAHYYNIQAADDTEGLCTVSCERSLAVIHVLRYLEASCCDSCSL